MAAGYWCSTPSPAKTVTGSTGGQVGRESGIIPDYAMFPDGRLCDTALFWKRLDR